MEQSRTCYAFVMLISMAACSSDSADKDYSAVQKELNQNKTLWTTQAIAHYKYDFTSLNFSIYSGVRYTVEVNQQVVVSVFNNQSSTAETPSRFPWLGTMEYQFGVIQDAINKKAYSITVTYNKDKGFVETFYIDYDKALADEENRGTIQNFVIL